jgi:hypothetical protein
MKRGARDCVGGKSGGWLLYSLKNGSLRIFASPDACDNLELSYDSEADIELSQ